MAENVNHAEPHDSPIYTQKGNPNRAESPASGSPAFEIAIATPPKKAAPHPNYGDERNMGSDSLPMTERNMGPSTLETKWMNQDWANMPDKAKREGSKDIPVVWPK
jgi:hypothetical protein